MKIHHVTDEWDYTISVDRTGDSSFLTLSILRQPDRAPECDWDGIRVRSWAGVAMNRRNDWGAVEEVWLRGHGSIRGVAGESRLPFLTHRAAIEQLIRVYNVLRHYEKNRGYL